MLAARAQPGRRRPGRPRRYGRDLVGPLEQLWEISDRLCGKLLAAVLPLLISAQERHGRRPLPPAQRQQLLALSPATIDRLLGPVRARRGRQPRHAAAGLPALKQQVPIRTWSDWADARPGALQGDLVLHCGESTEGFFLTTLVGVDVASSWTEREAIWGLGQLRVAGAVAHVHRRLPIPLREWHTDNGSEFLNASLLRYCRHQGIRLTRGRGYRKNDQAWVEQRNWLAVRRLVGYDRYSSRAALGILQRLYGLLRQHLNFFRPFRKLLSKRRVGRKVLKRYDRAQTPYQRLLAAGVLSEAQRLALEREFLTLDPLALSQQITHTLDTLWKLRDLQRSRARAQHE